MKNRKCASALKVLFARKASCALTRNFQKCVAGRAMNEVSLFRALAKTLSSSRVATIETHGNAHQIEVDPQPPWWKWLSQNKKKPRCEISDLLTVFFTESYVRVSFLQAKLNKKAVLSSGRPIFKGNRLQVHALGTKTKIVNRSKKTSIPEDMFKISNFESIGGIGVFYPLSPGGFGLVYCSASTVSTISKGPLKTFRNLSLESNTQQNVKYRGASKLKDTLLARSLESYLMELLLGNVGEHYDLKDDSSQLGWLYSCAMTALVSLEEDEGEKDEGKKDGGEKKKKVLREFVSLFSEDYEESTGSAFPCYTWVIDGREMDLEDWYRLVVGYQ